VLIICLAVLATVLCCDAWFDVVLDFGSAPEALTDGRRHLPVFQHHMAWNRPMIDVTAVPRLDLAVVLLGAGTHTEADDA